MSYGAQQGQRCSRVSNGSGAVVTRAPRVAMHTFYPDRREAEDGGRTLLEFHLRQLRELTEVEFLHHAAVPSTGGALVEHLGTDPEKRVVEVSLQKGLPPDLQRAFALERALDRSLSEDWTHACFLRLDAFPVAPGWLRALVRELWTREGIQNNETGLGYLQAAREREVSEFGSSAGRVRSSMEVWSPTWGGVARPPPGSDRDLEGMWEDIARVRGSAEALDAVAGRHAEPETVLPAWMCEVDSPQRVRQLDFSKNPGRASWRAMDPTLDASSSPEGTVPGRPGLEPDLRPGRCRRGPGHRGPCSAGSGIARMFRRRDLPGSCDRWDMKGAAPCSSSF